MFLVAASALGCTVEEPPLARFVDEPTDVYAWSLDQTEARLGYTLHDLHLVSQTWRTADEVDRTQWEHQLAVVVPDDVAYDTVLLVVVGGSRPELDEDDVALVAALATASRSPVAMVANVPNQPLHFNGTPQPVREDALVAYSWRRAMDERDPTWAAYLPMVRSVVRAMDAIQEYAIQDGTFGASSFVLTGFSKRGATTWLTTAVDDRVRAAAPGVFDVLHLAEQVERHHAAYGFYAPAISDYEEQGVLERLGTEDGQWLAQIVDPVHYADRLDVPLLILAATGDQFFLPDAAHLYLDDLSSTEVRFRQIPNTDHGLTGRLQDAITTLLAWYDAILEDRPRPTLTYREEAGQLVVESDPAPSVMLAWQAVNPETRDFRQEVVGGAWTSTPLEPRSDGTFVVPLDAPPEGWRGVLVEATYAGGALPETYSTPVFVTPRTLPHAE